MEGIVKIFADNEQGYLEWVKTHPRAFVVNCDRDLKRYFRLHRATCITIQSKAGHFTDTAFIKACSEDRKELERWVEQHPSTKKRKPCSHCFPGGA